MADDLPELSAEAEALLADWPIAHRAELDWDDFATQTLARALSDSSGVDSSLLEGPALEAEAGEPSYPRASAAVQVEPDLSLRELAIASLAAAKAEESHADIAQQALTMSRQERVSRPSFHDIPRTSGIRTAKLEPQVSSGDGSAQAETVTRIKPQPPARPQGGRRPGVVFAAVLGLAAAAAGLVLWQGQHDSGPVATAPTEARPTPQATNAARAASAPAPAAGLSVEPLVAEAPASAVPRGFGGAPNLAGSGPRLASLPTKPTAAAPAPSAPEEQDDPRLVPAAKPESLPLEPSTGAALAAVGRVMGGAKACVAGHGAASTATLAFASNGRVQSVSVGPPAAGTPAEGCIRSALSGARVAPFAKPSFTIRVPIRP